MDLHGTWRPATINTSTVGTTTYTFTPTDPCATQQQWMYVRITTRLHRHLHRSDHCVRIVPPPHYHTSNNGINGTWSPATISTAAVGTTTYTFTPTDPCATVATMDIAIRHTGNTNVYTDRTSVSEQYSTCTSCNI